jgi:hypothetical protein
MRGRVRARRVRSRRSADLPGSFWPSQTQELVLQVVLLPRESDARSAWEALRRALDIDDLEEGSYALLPLLYRRLRQLAISDALLARLRGVHQKTWVANQVSLSVMARAIQALESTHIKTMIVNDASMAIRVYPEAGVRPLTDIEVVIRATDSARAARALEDAGWHPQTRTAPEIAIASNSGLRFEAPDRSGTVVLRIHPVPGAAVAGLVNAETATRRLWESAMGADVEGIATLAPAATDELLYICTNGVRGRSWRTIQWVADATLVIRAGDADWKRLVSTARHQRLVLPLRDALTYLARLTDPPIPVTWQRELARAPVTRRESVAHYVGTRGGRLLGAFPSLIGDYIRAPAPTAPRRGVGHGLGFVKHVWGLGRWSEVPLFVARLLVERLSRGRRRHRQREVARSRTP